MTITPLYFLNTTDALTLITKFGTATDEQSIVTLLRSLCQQMGFDHFRLGFISPSSIQRPDVRIFNGCPAEWVQVYNERDFLTVDPVVRKGMVYSTPILWANLITECCGQQDAAGLEVMMLAQEAGLRDGITIPWHGPNGHLGLLSLITRTPRTEHQWLSAIPFLSWLATHIFEAVARVYLSGAAPRESLSQRELEVCQWAAEGKQVSDIAKILGITPRTVTFHLERIAEKLGASNKSQAISWALKQGLVRLNIDAALVGNISELSE
ncbi:LuxR family transcriptional regulator [Aeromonas sobria]|uniref:Transcriptional regulator n=1 Tax=Aeromonas sobria TaxID=646 RepID=A0A1S2CRG8_AERSO|nr:LuxR family transcriptional regulator [Aeromonas sobria]MBS4689349.1 LuxR family transcriptional regulator [Aeromonas sobria]OHY90638.1 transcriptional regulator [Aeromonas sobria]